MRMRMVLALMVLFVAASVVAQETPQTAPAATEEDAAAKPDFSRDTLIRVLAADDTPPEPEQRVRWVVGGVEFTALGLEWRIPFVPMAPLIGGRLATTNEWPDAFSLLNTPIATPPRAWRTQRGINAELRRIEREERRRATVVVTP